MSSVDESSSSDEEYVPPAKYLKKGGGSESFSSSEDDTDEPSDNGNERTSERQSFKRSLKTKKKDCSSQLENSSTNELNEDNRKEKELKLWNEFLESTNDKSIDKKMLNANGESVTVVKKFQFAGEEIEVKQKVNPNKWNSSDMSKSSNTQSAFNSNKPTLSIPKSGLSNALQNLKSVTGTKLPKLSTLEKSRLDWKEFVRKESLEDDLKAHNKGKQGYLERQAFMNRANEREYQFKRDLTSNSNRKQ